MSAPVPNPAMLDAKPAGDATDPARARRTQLELFPVPPASAPSPQSGSTDVVVPAGPMPAPVERAFSSTEPTDPTERTTVRTQPAQPSRRSSGSVVTQLLALSGQVARTVDSIPPARSARVPANVIESSVPDTEPAGPGARCRHSRPRRNCLCDAGPSDAGARRSPDWRTAAEDAGSWGVAAHSRYN